MIYITILGGVAAVIAVTLGGAYIESHRKIKRLETDLCDISYRNEKLREYSELLECVNAEQKLSIAQCYIDISERDKNIEVLRKRNSELLNTNSLYRNMLNSVYGMKPQN